MLWVNEGKQFKLSNFDCLCSLGSNVVQTLSNIFLELSFPLMVKVVALVMRVLFADENISSSTVEHPAQEGQEKLFFCQLFPSDPNRILGILTVLGNFSEIRGHFFDTPNAAIQSLFPSLSQDKELINAFFICCFKNMSPWVNMRECLGLLYFDGFHFLSKLFLLIIILLSFLSLSAEPIVIINSQASYRLF